MSREDGSRAAALAAELDPARHEIPGRALGGARPGSAQVALEHFPRAPHDRLLVPAVFARERPRPRRVDQGRAALGARERVGPPREGRADPILLPPPLSPKSRPRPGRGPLSLSRVWGQSGPRSGTRSEPRSRSNPGSPPAQLEVIEQKHQRAQLAGYTRRSRLLRRRAPFRRARTHKGSDWRGRPAAGPRRERASSRARSSNPLPASWEQPLLEAAHEAPGRVAVDPREAEQARRAGPREGEGVGQRAAARDLPGLGIEQLKAAQGASQSRLPARCSCE